MSEPESSPLTSDGEASELESLIDFSQVINTQVASACQQSHWSPPAFTLGVTFSSRPQHIDWSHRHARCMASGAPLECDILRWAGTKVHMAQTQQADATQAGAPGRLPDFRSMLEAALRGDIAPGPPGAPWLQGGDAGPPATARSTRSLGGFSELWSASEVCHAFDTALSGWCHDQQECMSHGPPTCDLLRKHGCSSSRGADSTQYAGMYSKYIK